MDTETSFTDSAVSLLNFAENTVVSAAQGALDATMQETAILFSIARGVRQSRCQNKTQNNREPYSLIGYSRDNFRF